MLLLVPFRKLKMVNLLVSFTDCGLGTGCSIGPMTMSGLMTVRSKTGLFSSMKFHAAISANFFDALYPRTASWRFIASSAVTYAKI